MTMSQVIFSCLCVALITQPALAQETAKKNSSPTPIAYSLSACSDYADGQLTARRDGGTGLRTALLGMCTSRILKRPLVASAMEKLGAAEVALEAVKYAIRNVNFGFINLMSAQNDGTDSWLASAAIHRHTAITTLLDLSKKIDNWSESNKQLNRLAPRNKSMEKHERSIRSRKAPLQERFSDSFEEFNVGGVGTLMAYAYRSKKFKHGGSLSKLLADQPDYTKIQTLGKDLYYSTFLWVDVAEIGLAAAAKVAVESLDKQEMIEAADSLQPAFENCISERKRIECIQELWTHSGEYPER